jgi:hypothetical protein
MELDGVEVTCAWCGRERLICRSCWRGQRYCCDACQAAAREVQVEKANRDYADSEKGRANQQKRQRRYRLKLAEAKRAQAAEKSVTDQATREVVAERILDVEPNHDAPSRRRRATPRQSKKEKRTDDPHAEVPERPPAGHGEVLRVMAAPPEAVCAECGERIHRLLVGPLPTILSLRGFG